MHLPWIDTDGSGEYSGHVWRPFSVHESGDGQLLGDGTYVVYKRLEPYGWTVAVQAAQDRVLVMESTIGIQPVFFRRGFPGVFYACTSLFPERIHRP